MRIMRFLFLLPLCFLLTSCFEYTQENWINRDGTGKASIDLSVPAALGLVLSNSPKESTEGQEEDLAWFLANKEAVKARLLADSAVTHCEIRDFTENGRYHIQITIDVNDVSAFPRLPKVASNTLQDGTSEDAAYRMDPKWLAYDWSLTLKGMDQNQAQTPNAGALLLFNEAKAVIRLHGDILSSNGTVLEQGKSVEWIIPASELFNPETKRTLTASVRVFPKWFWPAIGGAALLLTLGLVYAFRGKLAQKSQPKSARKQRRQSSQDEDSDIDKAEEPTDEEWPAPEEDHSPNGDDPITLRKPAHDPGPVMKFHCPSCGQRISTTEDQVGTPFTCPSCQASGTVPAVRKVR
jgi:hypothetical protein